MYPKVYRKIMEYFKRFAGVGKKTAEKMTLELLQNFSEADRDGFAKAIMDTKNIEKCSLCNILSDEKVCPICKSNKYPKKLIIVENSIDAFNIISTGSFLGYYYVVGGLIDYSKGITEESLNTDMLFKRINNFEEVIIALNSTVQGEFTTQYLINKIKEINPKQNVSRIAYGIPYGSELKYIGNETLKLAIKNRTKYDQK